MKSASVLAFFGLVATAFSASVDIMSQLGVNATAMGGVTAASAADSESGVASGAVDGAGAVQAAAAAGSALAGALSSPYM